MAPKGVGTQNWDPVLESTTQNYYNSEYEFRSDSDSLGAKGVVAQNSRLVGRGKKKKKRRMGTKGSGA